MFTWRRVIVLLLVVATTAAAYAVPPLQVQRRSNLRFGQILPGAPATVLWNDAGRAGQYRIRGGQNTEVLVDFLLPGQLSGRRGSSIPVAFGPGDAVFAPDGNLGSAIPFDPRVPTTLRLPPSGEGFIFLGGTALPPSQAATGTYRARVALTVTYTGN
jgi:hypothetical protein